MDQFEKGGGELKLEINRVPQSANPNEKLFALMWSRPDVLGLFSINVVSFSPNLVLRGLSFSINCADYRSRGRAGFEQFEIWRTRRNPIRVVLGKKGMRFHNNSNEKADD